MKQIKLTSGQTAMIDDNDFELISKYHWYADKGYNTYYASSNSNGNRNSPILMHRLILEITNSKINVDHKDGNGCNNQRNNLRVCTDSQNGGNRKISKNNTSGFKGVSWSKLKNRWYAQIQFKKKVINLGYFRNKEDAAKAYDLKATELFGEFARTNF